MLRGAGRESRLVFNRREPEERWCNLKCRGGQPGSHPFPSRPNSTLPPRVFRACSPGERFSFPHPLCDPLFPFPRPHPVLPLSAAPQNAPAFFIFAPFCGQIRFFRALRAFAANFSSFLNFVHFFQFRQKFVSIYEYEIRFPLTFFTLFRIFPAQNAPPVSSKQKKWPVFTFSPLSASQRSQPIKRSQRIKRSDNTPA